MLDGVIGVTASGYRRRGKPENTQKNPGDREDLRGGQFADWFSRTALAMTQHHRPLGSRGKCKEPVVVRQHTVHAMEYRLTGQRMQAGSYRDRRRLLAGLLW